MPGHLTTGKVSAKKGLANKRFAVVVANWNDAITEALCAGAIQSLLSHGVARRNIIRKDVPGSFELPLGALWMAEQKNIDAVICLGCVIQGETPHFNYICQAVALGVMEVGLKTRKPVVFGVLTTLDKKQAEERAGGKFGNKGEEAAITAVQMLGFNS